MDERRARARAPLVAGDPLRGFAALAVIVGHIVGVPILIWNDRVTPAQAIDAQGALGIPGEILNTGGLVGVSVFFVLSGYLLSRPFVRALVLDEPRPSLTRYFRNRILRLAPPYWAVLTLVLVLVGSQGAGAAQVARMYVFATEWFTNPLVLWVGQAWTLDVEAQFYVLLGAVGTLLVALAMRLRGRVDARWWIAGLFALALGVGVWSCVRHAQGPALVVGIAENLGRFMPGVALAVLESSALPRLRGRGPAVGAVLLFVAGLLVLVLATLGRDSAGLDWITTPAIFLGAGAVVGGPLLWQWSGRAPWRSLDNLALRWAGSRSYSLYLVHFAIFYELATSAGFDGYRRMSALLLVLGLPITLLAAELLHRSVEQPFLRRRAPSQVVPGA